MKKTVPLPYSDKASFPTSQREQEKSLSINEWDVADRPREKLAEKGAQALTDAELLAILIGSGSDKESAVALMQRIMTDCQGSLRRLGRMSIEDLCAYKGIGTAKAITLLAACEIGKRRGAESAEERPAMDSANAIFTYFQAKMEDLYREEFHAMFLNQNLRFIQSKCLAQGGMTATTVDIRLLVAEALKSKATCVAVCHNHPSGNPSPSVNDDQITQKINQALRFFDIRLIDHIIVGDRKYYSYAEAGKI